MYCMNDLTLYANNTPSYLFVVYHKLFRYVEFSCVHCKNIPSKVTLRFQTVINNRCGFGVSVFILLYRKSTDGSKNSLFIIKNLQ